MKTARRTTLPIGIDIGSRRVRAALCELDSGGEPRLVAVAARDHGGDRASALADALDELQTRERRCVVGLGAPEAILREIDFPPMPRWERVRAARFEAERFAGYPIDEATLSLVASTNGRWTLGIARRAAIENLLSTVRREHLHALAIDDVALALRRAHGAVTCIVDIGATATRVIRYAQIPAVTEIPLGGDHLTNAIALALGIDAAAAERRKRSAGLAGAGEAERDRLIAAIAGALDATNPFAAASGTITLCGNGARVPDLAPALSSATGCETALAVLAPEIAPELPSDVLRVAGADWSTAYGLCLWSRAA